MIFHKRRCLIGWSTITGQDADALQRVTSHNPNQHIFPRSRLQFTLAGPDSASRRRPRQRHPPGLQTATAAPSTTVTHLPRLLKNHPAKISSLCSRKSVSIPLLCSNLPGPYPTCLNTRQLRPPSTLPLGRGRLSLAQPPMAPSSVQYHPRGGLRPVSHVCPATSTCSCGTQLIFRHGDSPLLIWL